LMHFRLVTDTHESSSYQVFLKLVPLTGWVYSPDTECHFMLCLWGNQHGRPLALGSKGAEPTGAFFKNIFIHLFTCAYIFWTSPSPCPLPSPYPPHPPLLPGRTCSALISNFVEEKT
jgi:hypothetical protein